jgi:hypothetical protein
VRDAALTGYQSGETWGFPGKRSQELEMKSVASILDVLPARAELPLVCSAMFSFLARMDCQDKKAAYTRKGAEPTKTVLTSGVM